VLLASYADFNGQSEGRNLLHGSNKARAPLRMRKQWERKINRESRGSKVKLRWLLVEIGGKRM